MTERNYENVYLLMCSEHAQCYMLIIFDEVYAIDAVLTQCVKSCFARSVRFDDELNRLYSQLK